MLWLRALVVTVLVPGVVGGWLPLAIARAARHADLGVWHRLGLPLVALAWCGLLWCIVDFVRRGRGTLLPLDPPKRLVSSGLYRITRNPMYVCVLLSILGIALHTGASVLLAYAAGFVIVVTLFVRFHEEPFLRREFGEEYDRYRARVPRWLGPVRRER